MKTTDLDGLRDGINFTWGKLVKIHDSGQYTIVEYYPYIYENNCGTNKFNYSIREFSCYIDRKPIGHSCYSYDEALITCIAYKYDGCNSQAAAFFVRMINLKGE
jgi:hypothetical protein